MFVLNFMQKKKCAIVGTNFTCMIQYFEYGDIQYTGNKNAMFLCMQMYYHEARFYSHSDYVVSNICFTT